MTTSAGARMAATYALLRGAADIADHWVQTDAQAVTKSAQGKQASAGRAACGRHVAAYVAVQGLALLAGNRALDLGLSRRRIAAALAISGVTHYAADRREPLKRLAHATGKGNFWDLAPPLGGAYALDQAWHHGAELAAAVVAARP
ncbi:hypothetical protein OG216_46770 (plasmid) [Streptomycetaceae bacterium NBC_01309]